MGSGSEEGEVQRNPGCTRSGEMSQAHMDHILSPCILWNTTKIQNIVKK